MSHQEEWMPSMVKVILPIQDGDYTDGEIQRAFWLVGLRAQLAALEGLIEGHEGSAMVDRAKARIRELRKELEP